MPKIDAEFIQQLCAEQLITRRDRNGFRVREWQKMRERNEALDCYVYARAAASAAGLDRFEERHWRELERQLGVAPPPDAPPPIHDIELNEAPPQRWPRCFWKGNIVLMAENIKEHDRPLSGFKRRYRKAEGIKRLKRGADVLIAVLVPRVQLKKRLNVDRRTLEDFIGRKTLTGNERQNLERIKQTWRQAMAQPLLWGKDLERELIDYMEQNQGEFYRRGGLAKSDTVPAMLTPGEFVVNRQAVARYGAGFFEAINNLSAPAQALAGRALAGIQGFASGGLVQPASRSLPRPSLPEGAPTRTVRVELSSGQQKVNATVDARDEARLLQLLDAARARTA